jgi:hypothetical protein
MLPAASFLPRLPTTTALLLLYLLVVSSDRRCYLEVGLGIGGR